MRRFRFGRIATLFATVYVAVVIVSGVRALATGDPALLRGIVTGGWGADFVPFTWWVELLMVARCPPGAHLRPLRRAAGGP